MIRNIVALYPPQLPGLSDVMKTEMREHCDEATELSQLYTILREKAVELILVFGEFPGLSAAVIRRIRMRAPLADIWKMVPSGKVPGGDDHILFDGIIDMGDGEKVISSKITRILNQKELLKKINMIGRSEKLKLVAETVDRISAADISVLIIGPSGSGKELVARAIHENSKRSNGQFVAVNCGALAEGVLESELFGHEKGAFTGSVGKREGLFVQASGGTIFLDEIGETKPDIQVKLLRVLEDGMFYPVGGDRPVRVDVRVIAATNRELTEAINDGLFREDLYFRLGVIKIALPSLYERKEDILPLLYHFASRERVKGYSEGAIDILQRYDWPGNVRQLRNFVARTGALHPDREVTVADVEQFLAEQGVMQKQLPVVTGQTTEEAGHELIYRALLSLGNEVRMLRDLITANLPSRTEFENEINQVSGTEVHSRGSMEKMERDLIARTLREADGNRKAVARKLGIGERTLYRKLKKYNLS